MTLDGAVGVSFARVDNGLVVSHSTGLSAQANLCGQGETSFFCAPLFGGRADRDDSRPGKVDQRRSRLYASGSTPTRRSPSRSGVTHYSTPMSVITGRTFSASTYYRAAASYSRRFGTRLFGGVNLAARRLTQNGPDPKTDFSASLFIRYRFGDVQ